MCQIRLFICLDLCICICNCTLYIRVYLLGILGKNNTMCIVASIIVLRYVKCCLAINISTSFKVIYFCLIRKDVRQTYHSATSKPYKYLRWNRTKPIWHSRGADTEAKHTNRKEKEMHVLLACVRNFCVCECVCVEFIASICDFTLLFQSLSSPVPLLDNILRSDCCCYTGWFFRFCRLLVSIATLSLLSVTIVNSALFIYTPEII